MQEIEYAIPDGKRLIIIDAHDTALGRGPASSGSGLEMEQIHWTLRAGFRSFLMHFVERQRLGVAISSDAARGRLMERFEEAGVLHWLRGVFGREHLHPQSFLKQLHLITEAARVKPEEAVFLGDSRIDRLSAQKYSIDFIQIPAPPQATAGQTHAGPAAHAVDDFSFELFLPPGILEELRTPGPVRPESDEGRPMELRDIEHLNRKRRHMEAAGVPVFDRREDDIQNVGWLAPRTGPGHGGIVHVHRIEKLRVGPRTYFAKPETAYAPARESPLRYGSLMDFTESMFELGDGFTLEKTFPYPEEPEVHSITFRRRDLEAERERIASIDDDLPPGQIENAHVRALFVLYLARKERLQDLRSSEGEAVRSGDVVYDRRGRDILNEVTATMLGRLLGVPVPRYVFGIDGEVRLSLSRSIGPEDRVQPLDAYMIQCFRSRGQEGIHHALKARWHNANPLSIRYFEEAAAQVERPLDLELQLGRAALELLRAPGDLVRSDFLDHLLGATEDRKLQELVLLSGDRGRQRVYTVDYGEALFSQLGLAATDEHYQEVRERHIRGMKGYLARAVGLPPGDLYRTTVGRCLGLFLSLPHDFFHRFFRGLDARFYRYPAVDRQSAADERLNYDPATLADFFVCMSSDLRAWLAELTGDPTGAVVVEINASFLDLPEQ